MRILRLALIIGAVFTAVGAVLFYANLTPLLYVPGCMMNSMANGSGNAMHVGGVEWRLGSLVLNFLFFTAAAYWLIWMVLTLAGRNVAGLKK
jgi:hypothetical protein